MIEGKVMPMSPWICKIRSLLFHALAALLVSAGAAAEDVSGVDLSRYANAEEAKQAGEQLESSRQWVEAITLYEASLEAWQNDEGLKYALRRTRIHFGVKSFLVVTCSRVVMQQSNEFAVV